MKKTHSKFKISALILTVLISAAGLFGCNEDSVTSPADNFSFSYMSSTDSIGDAQGVLILDTVKILIKDIKLNVSNSSQDSTNFKVGPYVLFLNLGSSINFISSAIIPEGTYQKIKFEIHKLNDNEPVPDPEFADTNGRYSVIVKGSYMGNNFIYKSTKSAHQILQFPADIPVSAAQSNVTMIVKPYLWFIKNGVYLDPRDTVNTNDIDNNIKDNIKNNFKAFKDNDKNGFPD